MIAAARRHPVRGMLPFALVRRQQVTNEVFGTLQAYPVSAYVNDFKKFGRIWQARVQADHQFRVEPEDVRRLDVRDASGRMILVGTLVDLERTLGPVGPEYSYCLGKVVMMESLDGRKLEYMVRLG